MTQAVPKNSCKRSFRLFNGQAKSIPKHLKSSVFHKKDFSNCKTAFKSRRCLDRWVHPNLCREEDGQVASQTKHLSLLLRASTTHLDREMLCHHLTCNKFMRQQQLIRRSPNFQVLTVISKRCHQSSPNSSLLKQSPTSSLLPAPIPTKSPNAS